jgi:hypothetical protein
MAASLRPEVVRRLLLSKSLLAGTRFHPVADPDGAFVARQILTAHDAAELALGAIADQCNKLPPKDKCYLMNYFDSLKALDPSGDIPGRAYFRQLNEARIGIKHVGNFPDPKQWARVGEKVYEFLDDWCTRYLVTSFHELDESALLRSTAVKGHFDSAKQALDEGNYERVLVALGFALHLLLKENQALWGLRVGSPNPEDAIRLTGFGVHANDFLALQEFLPLVEEKDGDLRHKWKQSQFGHPGNWRKAGAEFCIATFLDVALKVQDARFVPGAVSFDTAYEYKITALRDGVEVWRYTQEPPHGASVPETLLGGKVHKELYRTLSTGESLRGRVEPVRSETPDDRFRAAFAGTPLPIAAIKILTYDDFETVYVTPDAVKVTCVPRESVEQYLSGLAEIDWNPD